MGPDDLPFEISGLGKAGPPDVDVYNALHQVGQPRPYTLPNGRLTQVPTRQSGKSFAMQQALMAAAIQAQTVTYRIDEYIDFEVDPPSPKENKLTMLEKILRLYKAAMINEVRGLVPHLVGPPGSGKSTTVKTAADMLNVRLHTINVSRISPLELEGVQMPNKTNTALSMLTATFWTQLEEGDILLLDEFLRGFPEVYNGLLDILTSRKVGSFELPNVFIIAASNSVIAYDRALEDRLLHLPVEDPRKDKQEEHRIRTRMVAELGLVPTIGASQAMTNVLTQEVWPTFAMLDTLDRSGRTRALTLDGSSVRNLMGQVQLRMVTSQPLLELIEYNNKMAMIQGMPENVVLLDGKAIPPSYTKEMERLYKTLEPGSILYRNLELNMELVQMEISRSDSAELTEEEDELFRNIAP